MITITTAALLCAALWAILCRFDRMQHRRTSLLVAVQHAILGLGLFAGLVLPIPWGMLTVSAGVFVFLLLGSSRWRSSAPSGIISPAPVDALHHVSGGRHAAGFQRPEE